MKRDRLKLEMVKSESAADLSSSVTVQQANISLIPDYGVEIAICSGFDKEGCSPLSDLLEILFQEGCDVVSCVSTQVNGRIFHTINSQVEDLTRLHLARLQYKLDHAILLSRND
ncbi:hypothetical protein SESBI_27947 [Sesbania bispinosa]|nr:hypothetical protein SESBI_27947 [Sesbania bispinosa]